MLFCLCCSCDTHCMYTSYGAMTERGLIPPSFGAHVKYVITKNSFTICSKVRWKQKRFGNKSVLLILFVVFDDILFFQIKTLLFPPLLLEEVITLMFKQQQQQQQQQQSRNGGAGGEQFLHRPCLMHYLEKISKLLK